MGIIYDIYSSGTVCIHSPNLPLLSLSHTYGVAAFHLVYRCLWSGESGVPPTASKLHKQAFIGRAPEVTHAQVATVCARSYLLVLREGEKKKERERDRDK